MSTKVAVNPPVVEPLKRRWRAAVESPSSSRRVPVEFPSKVEDKVEDKIEDDDEGDSLSSTWKGPSGNGGAWG